MELRLTSKRWPDRVSLRVLCRSNGLALELCRRGTA
jgi:hypothetical protein